MKKLQQMEKSNPVDQFGRRHNALKSGVYSKAAVLPWESVEEHAAFCAAVLSDYDARGVVEKLAARKLAETLWQFERVTNMTAIAMRGNPFGEAIERSGAQSWTEALQFLREQQQGVDDKLSSMAESLRKIAEVAVQLSEREEMSEDVERRLKKTLDQHEQVCDQFERLQKHLDGVRMFLAEFTADHILRRTEVESALGAQLDKDLARLQRIQEARLIRERLKEVPGAGRSGSDGGGDAAIAHANDGRLDVGSNAVATTSADNNVKEAAPDDGFLDQDDELDRATPFASSAVGQSSEPATSDLDDDDDDWASGNPAPDGRHKL